MRNLVRVLGVGAIVAAVIAPAAGASKKDKDYAQKSLNIIPSGQWGGAPVPPEADSQALMYDGLTPLFDQVGNSDLTTYFKSEGFGVGPDGPSTIEDVPRPGVTIERDRFNVPHVTGADARRRRSGPPAGSPPRTAGCCSPRRATTSRVGGDRRSRTSARSASSPGCRASSPSAQTEAEVAKQSEVLEDAGKEGRAVLHDIDVFISGINDYLAINSPSTEPWTRNDVFALNALKGQFLGEGGGDEARRSEFLAGLQQRLGAKKGKQVFDDLRQFKNPGVPTSVDGQLRLRAASPTSRRAT